MLVLLPPSEGKAPTPRRGRSLDLDDLSFPALTPVRERLVDALLDLCEGPPETARQALALPPGLVREVARNRDLLVAPTVPAAALYTGVLYDALGLATLGTAARRRATRSILVFSALWGVLRLTDRVPPYRLSADGRLPGVGPLPPVWRDPLAAVLPVAAGARLVLDLRSAAYAGLWRPSGDVAARTVTLRVLQERRPGDPSSRAVVSHFNKATKGLLVRALLKSDADPSTPQGLVDAVRGLGFVVEDHGAAGAGQPRRMDLVVTEV